MANPPNAASLQGNLPELTVSELSFSLKKSIEDQFGFVRVRGEVGRVSRPGSGHVYLDLKDDKAVLNGVIWKGVTSRLRIQPEQGLEVVCTGKLTTFPGQSRYQIVIDSMEAAGVGALMALLEERRKKLGAEGLFAEERKKPLPYLPEVIGVITSPSGAVIRDILHRLKDRFPRHVIIAPVLVQGDKAAGQIAEAITNFNGLPPNGSVPRPDVLIVARGGGSVEDLWAFNEEEVVRAAAASEIPLISAVGHETDTTLIDFASDRRAPTPTAAAEIAVPVRAELLSDALSLEGRLVRAGRRLFDDRSNLLQSISRGLPRLRDLLGLPQQKFDTVSAALATSLQSNIRRHELKLASSASGLRVSTIRSGLSQGSDRLTNLSQRLEMTSQRKWTSAQDRLEGVSKLLDAFSYKSILARGFSMVHTVDGQLVRSVADTQPGLEAIVRFEDGTAPVTFAASAGAPASKKSKKAVLKKPTKEDADPQGRLL
jgi:exodeoxyribonuclease VII large subunit